VLTEEAQLVLECVSLVCNFLVAFLVNQLVIQQQQQQQQQQQGGGQQGSQAGSPLATSPLRQQTPLKGKRILSAISHPGRAAPNRALGFAGNVATVCAAWSARAMFVNLSLATTSLPFLVAPFFLFLNPGYLFKLKTATRSRYLPMALVLFGYAVAISLADVHSLWLVEGTRFQLLKNALFALLPLPSLLFFAKFLNDSVAQDGFLWFNLTPINLVSLTLTDLFSIRLTSLLALGCSLARYLVAERVRRESLRQI